jgi:hypothetical protein
MQQKSMPKFMGVGALRSSVDWTVSMVRIDGVVQMAYQLVGLRLLVRTSTAPRLQHLASPFAFYFHR